MSIYEVTQLLQDKNTIQNDIEEATNLVKDMFYKKYLQKIQQEISTRQEQIKINRPKEIELLYALKPFVAEEKNVVIDKIAESIMMLKTISGMQLELKNKTNLEENSEHTDGIYDIDTQCITAKKNNFANAILMLAMCNMH